jgi:hypothetical protein
MSMDLRSMMGGAQAIPSMTTQMEAMKLQQTGMALQFAQNAAMSQYLWEDEKAGNEDAKVLRAKAKSLLQAYFDGLDVTSD